ncbi:helix-turn-helix domain-containing protein [Agathobaculum butyriciproducens]|nr:helix-turn-helix domain-containing protein [Agathobaculum butyriciproducens]
MNGDIVMAVSYNKLWKLLVDKKMSKSDLRKKAEIAPNTMTKLRRDEEVSLTILSKICKTLHADFGDIVEYVPDAEIWDLYNENRELLGKDHIRGEQLPIDGYHLVVHVWIRNSKGEYLISQRSANRPTYPLMWECVDGSVVKGEDSLQGVLREAKEEVGIDLLPEKGQVVLSDIKKIEFGKVVNKIVDVWLFDYDGEVDLDNATTDEVAQVAWMNREQIKELFDANMFVDTLEYFFTEVDK